MDMKARLTIAGPEDLALVKNLVRYYIYDMSEYMGWDCDTEGNYDGCDEMAENWQNPERFAYLIRVGDKLAGFAAVWPYRDEPGTMEVGEFFVLRKFKGQGIGRESAGWLFRAHPGNWLVRVLDDNIGARMFWEKVIGEYTNGAVVQTSEEYHCRRSGTWPMQFYRFESRRSHGSAQG